MIRPDPADCMVLLVDLQVAALATVRTIAPERLAANAGALVEAARLHDVPVVTTAGVRPDDGARLIGALAGIEPIGRTTADAFECAAVAQAVAAHRRATLVVAGIATDVGLLYAALAARARGLDVLAVLDASGTTDRHAERAAHARLAQAGVIASGVVSIAVGWMGDFSGPTAAATQRLLAQALAAAGHDETPFV